MLHCSRQKGVERNEQAASLEKIREYTLILASLDTHGDHFANTALDVRCEGLFKFCETRLRKRPLPLVLSFSYVLEKGN